MHLIENYARRAGALIDHPYITEQFYPLSTDKYVTISNSSGMPGKNYDYFQDVIDYILPKMIENGYTIIQIGNKDDAPLEGVLHLQGQTNINQLAYIIKNSSLLISPDSFPVHLASSYDIPIVGLYSVSPPSVCGPFFGSKNKQILLQPDFTKKKPSYNPNENPKRVNEIKLEDIITSVYKLLSINCPEGIITLHIGSNYTHPLIELVPNQVVSQGYASHLIVNIRADLVDEVNENIILTNLQQRKCSIIFNKELNNLNALSQLRPNIVALIYEITNEKFDIGFVNKLIAQNLFPHIIYKGTNIDFLNDVKMQVINIKLPIIQHFPPNQNNIDKVTKILDNETYIKSNRVVLSDQKVYLSTQHWREGKNTTSKEQKCEIENKQKLAEEEEFLYIVSKK